MLETFCNAIMNFEGGPNDLNHRNNNPGNFRCSPVGYLPKYGAVKCVNGFAVFPSFEQGWEYLEASANTFASATIRSIVSALFDGICFTYCGG